MREDIGYSVITVKSVTEGTPYVKEGWEPFGAAACPDNTWVMFLRRQGVPDAGTLDMRYDVRVVVSSAVEESFEPGWQPFAAIAAGDNLIFLRRSGLRVVGQDIDETMYRGLVSDEAEDTVPDKVCGSCKHVGDTFRMNVDSKELAECHRHSSYVEPSLDSCEDHEDAGEEG